MDGEVEALLMNGKIIMSVVYKGDTLTLNAHKNTHTLHERTTWGKCVVVVHVIA